MSTVQYHPLEGTLRADRLPHIWCPGCGLGIALGVFSTALIDLKFSLDKIAIVSGIGCTGRVAGYVNADSFHTTHGRAIPFAAGLHLANPDLKVVVFSGDGDLVGIGGNHFIHAARRNLDMVIVCVNNFTYGMTGGQVAPTTPINATTTTTPFGNVEYAFNLPQLAVAAGAVYVARWTVVDIVRLRKSLGEALKKRGFSFVEIISPCPTLYGRLNKLGTGVEMMQFFKEHAVHKPNARLEEIGIEVGGDIVVGKFIDRQRPTYMDLYHKGIEEKVERLHYERLLETEEKRTCEEF